MANKVEDQKPFWERAGSIGYGQAIFSNSQVERHIISKQWQTTIQMAESIGLDKSSRVLELGCGDGTFANNVLGQFYKSVDAFEASRSAVEQAIKASETGNINFQVEDLTTYDFSGAEPWDGAFLVGFLHHVKPFVPDIVDRLSKVCPKIVVLEPNGGNLIRKALELLPAYRAAGEDSFRFKALVDIFSARGYELKQSQYINFVPQFCPRILLPGLKIIENIIEPNPLFKKMCSTYVMGFQKKRD